METRVLKGGELAAKIRAEVKEEAEALASRGFSPRLVAVVVGEDPSVQSYISVKQRLAERVGVLFETIALPATASQKELEAAIDVLGKDPAVHGIVLELPLPSGLDADRALSRIPHAKDVDGLTSANIALALAGQESDALLAATAQACVMLAETEGSLAGKRVTLVGKGRTVGRPLIPLLLNRGATLTICHSKTKDLASATLEADIVIAAVGKADLITKAMVKGGQVVIDAGTVARDGVIVGDASPDIWGIVAAATPVPDGVGPLTTAFIFKNLIKAVKLQIT